MIKLGELLRRTREEKGLTVAEAAYQTKIREHYLVALESNQFSALPSVVQGKGYLRIYCQFLALDEKSLLDAWNDPDHLVTEITPTQEEELLEKKDEISLESTLSTIDNAKLEEGSSFIEKAEIEDDINEKIIHGDNLNTKKPSDEIQVSTSKTPLSDKKFVTIGEILKSQRNQLNLSLSEIEEFTNIRTHYLDAIENGKLEKLPSIPQARGMLNNYATFLNLDVDQIMIEFAEALQTRRNENYAPQKIGADNQLAYQTPEIKKVGWLKFITMDLILTSALIIGLFIFIIWGAASISGIKSDNDEIDAPSISDVLLNENPNPSDISEVEITELSKTESTLQVTSLAENALTNENGDEQPTQEGPALSGDPVQVYIIARQRAYLKVDVDGETVFSGRVVPGNAYEYAGSSFIELSTGNAAALEVFHNLNPLGAIGEFGEVKTLLFTSGSGFTTPTPRFSPSPTLTLQISPTSRPTATPTLAPPTPTPTVTQLIP